jgi:predicted glycoside hydrolase/deacetylase ChbG (UPF0249 family)
MSVNPAIERLGFQADDKVAIIHVDDVGMCGATLDAFSDLWAKRSVTTGSVMVPCPWFRATAAWARANPDVDLGVHATLTCEWDGYRWGPMSTSDMASGLMDEERAFHKTSEAVAMFAKPEAAKRELQLQIATAKEAGINATHLDTHMGGSINALSMRRWNPALRPSRSVLKKAVGIRITIRRSRSRYLLRQRARYSRGTCPCSTA